MHLIQALFLWLFMAGFAVGGAAAFLRFFPDESPWFGFLLPPLALVVTLNFLEHFVALPVLLWLFPVLIALLVGLMLRSAIAWRQLALPAGIFLGSFAFTYLIRCLQPDVLPSSDGISDLNKINNFCQGGTLPPIDTWLPPFHYVWYYSLQHYGASVIKRLFDVQIGVAYNVAHAFLSALTCTAGAAAAYRFSGGRIWITIAIPFVIESAATGSSPFIYFSMHHPSMWYASNPSGGALDYDHAVAAGAAANENPLWKSVLHTSLWQWLAQDPHRERLELQAPGFWTWRDEYHANASGHLLTLMAVFVVGELTLLKRSLWPWLLVVLIPLLAVDASTWAYPITGLLCGGAAVFALMLGRRPADLLFGGLILLGALILLWPSLYDVTSSPEVPDILRTKPEERVAWREFILQWWPIILLWICGLCLVVADLVNKNRPFNFGVAWVLVVVPLMLIGVELYTVEGRYNTVEKMWGYTWGTGLITLFPFIAARRQLACRIVTGLLLFSAAVSLFAWLRFTREVLRWQTAPFHLEGDSYILDDDQKKRMLHIMEQVKRATFLCGKTVYAYNESPALATFTGNRNYIAWTYFESVANYPREAEYRSGLNDDFFSGAMTDPLKFLHDNNITGVVIWPGDAIPDSYLATLKTALASSYDYIDCKGEGAQNAGIFLLRPLPPEVRLP